MKVLDSFLLGRQPIQDRSNTLVGYNLAPLADDACGSPMNADRISNSVISHTFNEIGYKKVLGRYRGFVPVSRNVLFSDVVEYLPKDNVALNLIGYFEIDAAFIERCKRLRTAGYKLVAEETCSIQTQDDALFDLVNLVKVNVNGLNGDEIVQVCRRLEKWKHNLIAGNVNDKATARICFERGFNLFQGYFFAKPEIIPGKRLTHSIMELISLIGMVMRDEDTAKIVDRFKKNAALSFSLIRLTNSAWFGSGSRVTSVNQAILKLGRKQLLRWLQMLLFAIDNMAGFPDPLLQLAATRGRFMELMSQQLQEDSEVENCAYMVGILSLMDTLLGVPLPEIMQSLDVPDVVSDALLSRRGELGKLLVMIEQLEQQDVDGIGQSIADLKVFDVSQVNNAHLEALAWSNQIGQIS
jgi:EAL and modified HD-GYP domain-containing signal transduction protein